jgi:hypothetical protein
MAVADRVVDEIAGRRRREQGREYLASTRDVISREARERGLQPTAQLRGEGEIVGRLSEHH